MRKPIVTETRPMGGEHPAMPFLWEFAEQANATIPFPGEYDDQLDVWSAVEGKARQPLVAIARSLMATQTFTFVQAESTDKD